MLKRFTHGLLRWFRNAFGFTRVEERGTALLLLMLTGFILATLLVPKLIERDPVITADDWFIIQNDSIANTKTQKKRVEPHLSDSSNSLPLKKIDPNNASHSSLVAMGLPDFLANRIINYRSAGGRFYKPEDLLKIYGMDTLLFFDKLMPVIAIQNQRKSTIKSSHQVDTNRAIPYQKRNLPLNIDLNQADSMELKLVPGIGTVLSARIVRYRIALGGFINVNQLEEVYNITDYGFQYLTDNGYISDSFIPTQLNINEVPLAELANHPYISWNLARHIINYRDQHGSYASVDELFKLKAIDSMIIRRVIPYLNSAN